MKVVHKQKNIFSKLNQHRTNVFKKIYQKTSKNIFLKALASTTRKFCDNTTLHGLKYILGDDNASHFEENSRSRRALIALRKLFTGLIWSCMCFGLALFAITLMRLVYDKYNVTPIITVVDTNNYPIWNVNFPSLTVCSINKVYAPAAKNITKQLLEKGFSNETIMQFLHKLGKLIRPDYINATFISLYATLEELGYSTESMMFELRQPCERLIQQCVLLGKIVRCDHLFRTSRSSEGFCCAFNYKASKQYLETDNNTNSLEQINAPILRVSGYGPFVGLTLTILPEVEHYITDTDHVGVVMFVHGPFDYPDTKVSYVLGHPGSDVNIAVIPNVVESSDAIRDLPLEKRKCYFEDERILQVSPIYSFQGCVIDCVVEHIVEYCGCIPFFFPHSHLPKYKNNRQCNLRDVICLRENQHIFSSLRVPTVELVDVNDTLFGMDCDCLPSCSEQLYEVETTICHRSKLDRLRSVVYGQAFDPENSTTVKIHFKDISCIKYRRELYLTWDGVFAAFGGIFSLCWGGSIISLFEFVYFYTFELVEHLLASKQEIVDKKHRLHMLASKHEIVDKRHRFRNMIGMDNRARFKPNKSKIIFHTNFDYQATYLN